MPATSWGSETINKTAFTGETIPKTFWDPENDDPPTGALLLQNGGQILFQSGAPMNLELQ